MVGPDALRMVSGVLLGMLEERLAFDFPDLYADWREPVITGIAEGSPGRALILATITMAELHLAAFYPQCRG